MAKSIAETGKSLVQSKTFWFNLLASIVAVASLFGFGEFQPSEGTTETIAAVVALVNIGLRIKTKAPITRIK